MRLVSVEQMISLEKEANASGLSYTQMMNNAGMGLVNLILSRYAALENPVVLGLVGSGNNGGDTLVALSELADLGWETYAYLVKPRPSGDDLVRHYIKTGSFLINEKEDNDLSKLNELLGKAHILLDGVLGTGVKLPLADRVAQILKYCQEYTERPFTIAVDCPSGVDSFTGSAASECIPADLTVCMGVVKNGLLRFPAFQYVGGLNTVDINLPDDLKAWGDNRDEVLDAGMIKNLIPPRPLEAHKGTFGTSMVVAGSTNYAGAVLMAGRAAYRIGAGLVRIAIPSHLYSALVGHLPEATWLLLPHSDGVLNQDGVDLLTKNLEKVTSILLGSGWGMEETTQRFLEKFLTHAGKASPRSFMGFSGPDSSRSADKVVQIPPMVVDADGLKLLANIKGWSNLLPKRSILTPHMGEMAALTGLDIASIQSDRIEIARKYSSQWGHILVLKGALSIVAHPDGYIWIVPVATPALARAGTGDVLAGMITGLCAQGLDPFHAAAVGAWVHAQAGLIAAEWMGSTASVLAEDVIEAIPEVLCDLENKNRRL